jgi:hypothetical protein
MRLWSIRSYKKYNLLQGRKRTIHNTEQKLGLNSSVTGRKRQYSDSLPIYLTDRWNATLGVVPAFCNPIVGNGSLPTTFVVVTTCRGEQASFRIGAVRLSEALHDHQQTFPQASINSNKPPGIVHSVQTFVKALFCILAFTNSNEGASVGAGKIGCPIPWTNAPGSAVCEGIAPTANPIAEEINIATGASLKNEAIAR